MDTNELYFQEVRREPFYTPEEIRVFAEAKDSTGGTVNAEGREARERIIRSHLALVLHVAQDYQGLGILSWEDLVAVGNVGLVRAADAYHTNYHTVFNTLAEPYIRTEIRRAVARERCRQRGRRPLPKEPETSPNIQRALRLSRTPLVPPAELLAYEELLAKAQRLLDQLPSRETAVLSLYLGLRGIAPHSLTEIAQLVGKSRARISQIKVRALARLRALMAEDL